jgi:DNA-binding SARP family transcriptional activator
MEGIVCTAAVTLAKRALDAGRLDEARRYASTAAAVDQYDETACEVSIRALLARGDVDSARREFRRYGATLAADLGATPSERLAGLVGLTSLRVPTDP